jgi:hypothetical protein
MSADFVPVNELEERLMCAATDETARPRFIRALLDSDLYVLTIHDKVGIRILPVQRDGAELVPIFSSLVRLENFARAVGAKGDKHEQASGRELFEILKATTVMLNPNSGYGKEFNPQEIQEALDGTLLKRMKIISIDESQPALFSQPADFPQELIDDLKASFAFSDAVSRAYLAQIHTNGREFPQLVIGIEADEGYEPREPMDIVIESLGDDEFVTFLRLADDPLSEHMLEKTEPFYTRTKTPDGER